MEWHPQPRQEVFLRLACYEALFGGTKGPGKTDALLAESTRQLGTPGYQAIILRRTMPKLSEVIERSYKWFSKTKAAWNGEKHRWTWPNRNFISFGHCKDEKDKYNYQGHEYGFVGFDQLEEFTETQYLFLLAQNRSSEEGINCYTRSTANPGNIGHAWVKRRFIEKLGKNGEIKYFKRDDDEDIETSKDDPDAMSRAFVFATVEDNYALLKNDPNYIKRLMMLPESDKKALRFGDWDVFAGQYFKEFSKRIHVIPEFTASEFTNNFIALDYGFRNQSSVGWYACLPDGKIIRYRELYDNGYSYEDLAVKILEMTGSEKIMYAVADPAIWGDSQHHLQNAYKFQPGQIKGESGGDLMMNIFRSKFPLLRADNSRIIGWGRMRKQLKPYIADDGSMTANFLVTANCKNFIRTIPGLIHDTLKPEDLDTDGEDHVADEARYACMSRPLVPDAPKKKGTPAQEFWNRVNADKDRSTMGAETREIATEGCRSI